MKGQEFNRLKRRMGAKAERERLKREAFDVLKQRVTQARVKDILPTYQRIVREKRPPPAPATAKQVEALDLKIENIKPAPPPPPQPPPQVNVPEPKVIVEPPRPDPMLHEKLGELADVNRDMSRMMEQVVSLLDTRESEIEISITGRDKKGNIKTLEVKRI